MTKTMLDVLREKDPESIDKKFPGGVRICPEDIGFPQMKICEYFRAGKDIDHESCLKCWDRPIPEK